MQCNTHDTTHGATPTTPHAVQCLRHHMQCNNHNHNTTMQRNNRNCDIMSHDTPITTATQHGMTTPTTTMQQPQPQHNTAQ